MVLADALRVKLDDVTAAAEFVPARTPFDIPMGHIAEGSIAGYRFEIMGMKADVPVITAEHVTRHTTARHDCARLADPRPWRTSRDD